MNNNLNKKPDFTNEVINKKKLQQLMATTFQNYGIIKSSLIADRVKNLTFHYATLSGISLSVEDLRVPFTKSKLIGMTNNDVDFTEQNYTSGNITTVERFQKIIDIWNNANNVLKDEVLTYFRESDPLNPLYIMAFSGARGNISQVRQLVGMRGLMADPQGQIIDLPIKSNFREGLKVTEYIISSYGARKGLVDTALRTADSGYLTRRLVDVAQDIIVRDEDCLTTDGLSLTDFTGQKPNKQLNKDRLIGRLLAKPFSVDEKGIHWEANTEITDARATLLLQSSTKNFELRSPLTCNALRSVCRKCYGWHLSYSKIIDLGEAVGILAAQSIGEPGTQLTMRTFHTGGVFSGDLTEQIRAPFGGTVRYTLNLPVNLVRTIHGEKGFQLNEKVLLSIETQNQTYCSVTVPKGALLLINNEQKVYRNQVLGEIKKDANLILEEDRQDIYTEVSGEIFLQNVKVAESIDGEGATKQISETTGLIWVLYGKRYTLQKSTTLNVKLGQKFVPKQTIASQILSNKHPGVVKVLKSGNKVQINILTSSMVLENCIVEKNVETGEDKLLVVTDDQKTYQFQLYCKKGEHLKHGQALASLIDDSYKTETGGIVYYSTQSNFGKKKKNTKKQFTGSLYFVPEETHYIKQLQNIRWEFSEGKFIKAGEQLYKNIQTNVSGFIEINEADSEITIKPGELYRLTGSDTERALPIKGFIQPGHSINLGTDTKIYIQKLSYLEPVTYNGLDYILLRPVFVHTVPQDKGFVLNHKFFPVTPTRGITLRTVKRIFYKDGEKIKTNKGGVDLLQTFLVLDIKNKTSDLKALLEYTSNNTNQGCKMRIALYEAIPVKESLFKDFQTESELFVKYLVNANQYVLPNTSIAKINLVAKTEATLVNVNQTNNNIEFLLLQENAIKTCFYDNLKEKPIIQIGDLVRVGTYITTNTRSKYAGQIYQIDNGAIQIRLGRPYLISPGTVLRVRPYSLVEKADMLATLVYEKLKTVDIVQGLPKIEEILEARKIKNACILAPHEGKVFFKDNKIELTKPNGEIVVILVEPNVNVKFTNGSYVQFLEQLTDGPINPHSKLETLFSYFQLQYPAHIACKKSFKKLQLFLVEEVQRTYFSQGVDIADKHIEVIVKQMTSKVRVTGGGDTTLLPGEILDIGQAEIIANAAINNNEEPPTYQPMLLGLTKASLNSDSFISAASFQETTRVLTEAAIEGKKDWLNGLKENVIIGRLIPAGTGFNSFENLKKSRNVNAPNNLIRQMEAKNLKAAILNTRLT